MNQGYAIKRYLLIIGSQFIGLVQQPDKIVARFARTIYPYSLASAVVGFNFGSLAFGLAYPFFFAEMLYFPVDLLLVERLSDNARNAGSVSSINSKPILTLALNHF